MESSKAQEGNEVVEIDQKNKKTFSLSSWQ
jgi:hypothetical protein